MLRTTEEVAKSTELFEVVNQYRLRVPFTAEDEKQLQRFKETARVLKKAGYKAKAEELESRVACLERKRQIAQEVEKLEKKYLVFRIPNFEDDDRGIYNIDLLNGKLFCTVRIRDYVGPLPMQVVQRTKEAEKEGFENFRIWFIAEESEVAHLYRARVRDPFLVAYQHGYAVLLAVWGKDIEDFDNYFGSPLGGSNDEEKKDQKDPD